MSQNPATEPNVSVQDVDIAIVGGGMVGASLALLLSSLNLGWRINVIEAFPMTPVSGDLQPSFDARSTALSHSSREIFEMLGLWSTLAPRLAEIKEVHVSDRGHIGNTRLHAAEQNLPALGYVVENQWLGSVLMEALQQAPGVDIIAPAQVASVRPARGGMKLSLSSSEVSLELKQELSVKLLVVADGAQSRTREMLGIDATTRDYGQVALVTNISLQQDHQGVAYERFTDSGPMAMLPLQPVDNEHRSALVWTLPPERAAEMMEASDEVFLAELQDRFGHRLGQFQRVGTRHSYPIRLITSNEQVRSHVVVVGNAAHSLHPVAGQGFNLALRDVAVLANELATSASNDALGQLSGLQHYLKQQQADQKQTILLSDLLPKLFGIDSSPVALARNLGLLALDTVPLLRHQFARLGMGLETRGAPQVAK
ncbi:MAG: 2-octaprenyl-6-methoxyphenyl hydroxylase, partial [Porticoccus sp.]|nr:2-octaprenyl-6-methoxyphenyl hydroxylase [Porticoccus sp.]